MKKEIKVVNGVNLPKELKDRLMDKIVAKNDDKIINALEQRASHIEAIKRIDAEIETLTSLNGLN